MSATKKIDEAEIQKAQDLALQKNEQRKVPTPAHYPKLTEAQRAVVETPINHAELCGAIQKDMGHINRAVYEKYRNDSAKPIWNDKN